ncbi:uncharacterized protein LOC106703401 [Latimeria chalumnae]|uniref:uncharacterized protein LOC106703401 n=1 Tax=Latimeria chalumnae TaxID=7897 RepID=UPI0006D8F6C9|nr:PREDICTED: uncharacterized protein LOC106703401 [Latimeria chalumnae]|eukprot:XP_014343659.1 PREDICTED: uncharacterized protein LOC106703401 [Latimeria chalumnae]
MARSTFSYLMILPFGLLLILHHSVYAQNETTSTSKPVETTAQTVSLPVIEKENGSEEIAAMEPTSTVVPKEESTHNGTREMVVTTLSTSSTTLGFVNTSASATEKITTHKTDLPVNTTISTSTNRRWRAVSSTTTEKTTVKPGTPAKVHPMQPTPAKLWIIIIIAIVVAIVLIMLLILLLRKMNRRYSFDLHHKSAEDTEIPLSPIGGAFEPLASDLNDEKVVNHDAKPSENSSPKENNVDVAAEKEMEESKNDEEPDKESTNSHASLLPAGDQQQKPKDTNEDNDSNITTPDTSQEVLTDQQNENNSNNNFAGGLVGVPSGQLYVSPTFTVVTCRKNKESIPGAGNRRMKEPAPDDVRGKDEDIISIKIEAEVDKTGWPGAPPDNSFCEIELLHEE